MFRLEIAIGNRLRFYSIYIFGGNARGSMLQDRKFHSGSCLMQVFELSTVHLIGSDPRYLATVWFASFREQPTLDISIKKSKATQLSQYFNKVFILYKRIEILIIYC